MTHPQIADVLEIPERLTDRGLGNAELLSDPRFHQARARLVHPGHDALEDLLGQRLVACGDRARGVQLVAEDLAQEVRVVIEQKYGDVTALEELLPLSLKILRFKLAAFRRKQERRGVTEDVASGKVTTESTDAQTENAPLTPHNHGVSRSLSASCRPGSSSTRSSRLSGIADYVFGRACRSAPT